MTPTEARSTRCSTACVNLTEGCREEPMNLEALSPRVRSQSSLVGFPADAPVIVHDEILHCVQKRVDLGHK